MSDRDGILVIQTDYGPIAVGNLDDPDNFFGTAERLSSIWQDAAHGLNPIGDVWYVPAWAGEPVKVSVSQHGAGRYDEDDYAHPYVELTLPALPGGPTPGIPEPLIEFGYRVDGRC